MKFVSLGAESPTVSITEAIVQGMAHDGGLYVPALWPKLDHSKLQNISEFHSFATEVLAPFFEGDSLALELEQICKAAFNFAIPSVSLGKKSELLELFHGPTCAFKDFGARFLALCINRIPTHARSSSHIPERERRLVLVATSGDTGGAVASAFHSLTQIPVLILYPKNGVTERQEKQLTTWGAQVRAFAVDGSFDDCQRMVKNALKSETWRSRHQMISANSINLGRLLPQMAYFSFASQRYQAVHGHPVTVIIPSGNMGNASAALWAVQLGFPIEKVIFAHNANRTVPVFYESGKWQPQPSVTTLANAMDVGNPSNFPRIQKLHPESVLRKLTDAVSVSDREIQSAVHAAFQNWRQIVCPHTAVGIHVGLKLNAQNKNHWMVVATAHPAKFEKILEPLLAQDLEAAGLSPVIDVPHSLQALLNRNMERAEIQPELQSLEQSWF